MRKSMLISLHRQRIGAQSAFCIPKSTLPECMTRCAICNPSWVGKPGQEQQAGNDLGSILVHYTIVTLMHDTQRAMIWIAVLEAFQQSCQYVDSILCTCKAVARLINRGQPEAKGKSEVGQAAKTGSAEFANFYSLLGLHLGQEVCTGLIAFSTGCQWLMARASQVQCQ